MVTDKLGSKLRRRFYRALKSQDFLSLYKIEQEYQNSTHEYLDDLLTDLPESYLKWAEMKKANEILNQMTLQDIINNLKEFYWINHQSPKVMFILNTGEKVKTPLTKDQQTIPVNQIHQIAIKTLSKQTEDTYESMINSNSVQDKI